FLFLLICIFQINAIGFADEKHDETNKKQESELTYVEWLWQQSDKAFHAGDYERAVRLHRNIVYFDPTDVESYSVAAWLLWSMEKADESNEHITKGLKANPKNWEMWDVAGQHYDLQKLHQLSQPAYEKSVELIPKEADSQLVR